MRSMYKIRLNDKKTFFSKIKSYCLYQRAFPKEEKKPYWLIRKVEQSGFGKNYIIETDEGDFRGIAYTITNGDYVLLDYFAVDEKYRGTGIGAKALQCLMEQFRETPIVVEIENPDISCDNSEQRKRREQFYIRCGMKRMNYHISLFGVDMCILTSGEEISFERYHAMLYQVFGESFSQNIELLL